MNPLNYIKSAEVIKEGYLYNIHTIETIYNTPIIISTQMNGHIDYQQK